MASRPIESTIPPETTESTSQRQGCIPSTSYTTEINNMNLPLANVPEHTNRQLSNIPEQRTLQRHVSGTHIISMM